MSISYEELEIIDDDCHQTAQRFLTFLLNNEEYAIEISRVMEIRSWEKATHLPLSEHFVTGVINMRGSIVPIIDLRLRFGLKEIKPTKSTTIIIVQVDEETKSRLLGIIVDAVLDIHEIDSKNIQDEGNVKSAATSDCVMGLANVGDKFLIILDQNNFLSINLPE